MTLSLLAQDYVLSTKLSFHILFTSASCAHPSQAGL